MTDLKIMVDRYLSVQEEFNTAKDNIEFSFAPMIHRYHEIEPVPCGHTGGWSFDHIENGRLYLIHECWYAHSYDIPAVFRTSLTLERAIELTTNWTDKGESE